MTKETPPKYWIDPRLIRPANWSPPPISEDFYSRRFGSVEGGERNILISVQLASIAGTLQFANWCLLFYTDTVSPTNSTGYYRSLWNSDDETLDAVQAMLPYVESDILDFCQIWLSLMRSLEEVNQKMTDNFVSILNVNKPVCNEEFDKLGKLIEINRKDYGPFWTSIPEFSCLIEQVNQIVIGLQGLLLRYQEIRKNLSSHISSEDRENLFGNQKIRIQFEAAQNDPHHKRVIKKLNNLLAKNPPRNQVYQIYKELGFRYTEICEYQNAIDSYSKSIQFARIPDPLVHFWRGEIYYHEKDWGNALKDFEKAIELEVYSPEREQALELITYIKSQF